jgi:hypothetical protein
MEIEMSREIDARSDVRRLKGGPKMTFEYVVEARASREAGWYLVGRYSTKRAAKVAAAALSSQHTEVTITECVAGDRVDVIHHS